MSARNALRVHEGDVLLFTPSTGKPKSRALGNAIAAIDVSPFSHTAIVFEEGGDLRLASANQADEKFDVVSGVNNLDPGLFNGWEALVLRPSADVGKKAVEHAKSWIEPPDGDPDPADFAWFILGVSGLVATARHLKPKSRARRRIEGFARWLVDLELGGIDPCGTGPSIPDPKSGPVDKFYCASFVDHAFCAAGVPLNVLESDPDPRDFSGMVRKLMTIVRELECSGSLDDEGFTWIEDIFCDELFDDDDVDEASEGLGDVLRLLREALKLVWCKVGKPEPPLVEDLDVDGTGIGDPVYPPFIGLRHLHERALNADDIEIVNPGGKPILVEELDFGNDRVPAP